MAQEKKVKPEKKKWGFWKGFLKFMMYGGWLLLLLAIFAIIIVISVITNGQS